MIEESSVQWWSKWSKQVAKLQLLRANAENQRKEGDEFSKLDKESIVDVKEELADDFLALVDEMIAVVRRLVAWLDEDQFENQVQFERYEKERRWQEAAKRPTAIHIRDEDQSSEQVSGKAEGGTSQPDITQEEQPK